MKFILNSNINTLSTQNNLKRWNKAYSNKCLLCQTCDSTLHCLNGCKVMLDQKRYTWRHDNVIKYITDNIDKSYTVYSDIKGGNSINGGTIPPHLMVTEQRPDIVIIDKDSVNIFELTVPFETNINVRHTDKVNKYSNLLTDITVLKPTLEAFEIGSRGTITPDNRERLKKIHKYIQKNISFKNFTN